jgi:hypothetical protein
MRCAEGGGLEPHPVPTGLAVISRLSHHATSPSCRRWCRCFAGDATRPKETRPQTTRPAEPVALSHAGQQGTELPSVREYTPSDSRWLVRDDARKRLGAGGRMLCAQRGKADERQRDHHARPSRDGSTGRRVLAKYLRLCGASCREELNSDTEMCLSEHLHGSQICLAAYVRHGVLGCPGGRRASKPKSRDHQSCTRSHE